MLFWEKSRGKGTDQESDIEQRAAAAQRAGAAIALQQAEEKKKKESDIRSLLRQMWGKD